MADILPVFVADDRPLRGADAAAAILLLDDGRYLMQLRDDKPGIWYPGHWGCFGGAVEPGERSDQALARELEEEIGLAPSEISLMTRFRFDLRFVGQDDIYRDYYVVSLPAARLDDLVLTEGRELRAFDGARLLAECRLVPYDAFAVWMHYSRHRLEAGAKLEDHP